MTGHEWALRVQDDHSDEDGIDGDKDPEAAKKRGSESKGTASALGVILLTATLILYYVYNKLVGIDRMKLG